MSDTDIRQTTTTELKSGVPDYSVPLVSLESAESDEFYYYNPDFTKFLGYYKNIPELKSAIDTLATWVVGKGYTTDMMTKIILESLTGHGKDNDDTLLFNIFVMKKINGDSYTQIIRNEDDELINLKPLNPSRVRIVFDKNGIIKRYDFWQIGNSWKKIETENMLHLINNRIGDEVHGISVIEACQWVIDARNEAMSDKRRLLHRSTIRVIEVDMDDTTKLTNLKNDYKEAVKKGEVLFIPKGTSAFADIKPLSTADHSDWIRYLENFFYQIVGTPRIILTQEGTTEAGGKIGYLSFEPPYTREQQILEAELWNQLGLKLTFNRPPSLSTMLQEEQTKNQVQTGFQESEFEVGRNE